MAALHHPVTGELLAPVPPGRTARRLTWRHLPPAVRAAVEQRCGAAVVDAESQDSGFTPGFASRLLLADGCRVFVKAASRDAQAACARAYEEEARIHSLLRVPRLPAPRLLWTDPDLHGWTLLVFQDVEGRPPLRPWQPAELHACLDALTAVARETATIDPELGLQPLTEGLPTFVSGWDLLADVGERWPHHDELAELARAYTDLEGREQHFVHLDARDDNFLVTEDGTAVLCDWNWHALGPQWVDVVHLLVSAHGDGLDADRHLAEHPLGAAAPADDVDVFLAALCGLMAEADLRPVPRNSPYLGVHRRWWAAAAHSWLGRRRGWD
jgi:aminoglycoside phosphotransferase (APT) family kinase protein